MHTSRLSRKLILVCLHLQSCLYIVKLIPPHKYGTRANVRLRMEYQEQHNAEVRMEIDELKSGMTKLTEMLQVLIARGEPPQKTVIVEVSRADVDPQPTQQPPSTWPEFGLSPGYTPPFEKTPGFGQSSQLVIAQASNPVFHAPVFTESHPIMHIVAQPTYVN